MTGRSERGASSSNQRRTSFTQSISRRLPKKEGVLHPEHPCTSACLHTLQMPPAFVRRLRQGRHSPPAVKSGRFSTFDFPIFHISFIDCLIVMGPPGLEPGTYRL